ncbi:hypothetical protein PhaeoP78_00880 [Phaeobacter inhibens]|nr:hypothetical protein PhaeoP78_00880 [Phaeobacter inhibens]
MVWGLLKPKGFGDYWPDGEFSGWDEALKDYYKNEMPDEERAALGLEEHFFPSSVVRKFTMDLGPVKPRECPKEFHAVKAHNKLADLIGTENGVFAVSEVFKFLIEELEPGVHQFWPLKIIMPGGQLYPAPYYGIVIGRFLDSFVPEQCPDGIWLHKKNRSLALSTTKKDFLKMPLSRDVFQGAHLWRENRPNYPLLFLSDELRSRVSRANLRLTPIYQLKSV